MKSPVVGRVGSPDGRAPPPAEEGLVEPFGPEAGRWLRRLWPVWWRHRRTIFGALAAATVAMIAQQGVPLVQRNVIDNVIVPGHLHRLPVLLAVMGGLFAIRFVAGWLRRALGGRIAWDVDFDLRCAVFRHVQRLDFARFDELATGQIVSRTNSDLTLMRQLLSQAPNVASNVLQFLLALGIMLSISPILTAASMPAVPLLFYLAARMRGVVYPSQWEAQARMAEMVTVVEDAVSGVRVVKGFGQEDRELSRLLGSLEVLYGSRMRNLRLRARRSSTLQAIPQLAQAVVLLFGGWLALEGRISVGDLLAFSVYLTQLAAPARQMAGLVVTAQQARAGAERVLELFDAHADIAERVDAVDLPPAAGAVRFDRVRFGYLPSEPVLKDFSLEIAPGSTVAFVGTSGSGKSTIGLLLPRFYDPQAGRVTIDGVDVRDVTFSSLRSQIGVVFEDAFLFSDTVRANIAYGRPDATDEEVRAAARAAEADRFVEALPDGYDTVVGERGLLLSGGQRQRITLARALLTDPRLLILDDATSSVDALVEAEIHDTLRRLMVGRTTLLVAHRRSTLRLAQRVVVLDQGRIVDDGTHQELAARCALYRELLTGPMDDEIADDEVALPTDAVTADAWRDPAAEGSNAAVALKMRELGLAVPASGFARASNRNHAMLAAPPTPELLAKIAALPAVRDVSDVDLERETLPDPDAFSFFSYLRRFWRLFALGATFVLLDAVCGLVGPAVTGSVIAHGIRLHHMAVLVTLGSLYAFVQIVDWGLMWAESFWTGRTAERLLLGLRAKVFAHFQRLGIDFYEREMTGRLLTRMTSDVDALSTLLQSGLVNALVNGVSVVGVSIILVLLDPRLALVVLCLVPVLVAATTAYQRRSRRIYDLQRERIAAVNANLQENVSGVRVTQAFRREAHNTATFVDLVDGYRATGVQSQRIQALYFSVAELVGNIGTLLILAVGAHLMASAHGVGRAVAIGVLASFILYLAQLFAPIQQLSQVFDSWQQASAALRRLVGVLNTPTSTPTADRPLSVGRPRGEIRLEGVRFAYPGSSVEALAGVDLTIGAGESVALVGETGAGKSTVVKLVARFYDPTAGRVLIDGRPVAELDLGAFRRTLGYVPQEPFLFAGTIRENVAYGRPDATDAEVEAAARAVGAHEAIVAIGGYHAVVSERGRSLSIGQRQLVCLARALLVDPAVILLDEATANLDLATEARVNRAMGVVASGRTTIVIAHRLETAKRADRIVVIDDGRVVEEGDHDALVRLGGRYALLWAAFEPNLAEAQSVGASGGT